jgi:hypothetical protein
MCCYRFIEFQLGAMAESGRKKEKKKCQVSKGGGAGNLFDAKLESPIFRGLKNGRI